MSKDSSPSHIHFHHPRLADVFEDFTRPHTSLFSNLSSNANSSPVTVPSFLPIEEIYVPPQYQPLNPEDEDDVVPDQHAAFGITRAMDGGREVVWRDFGLEELARGVRGVGLGGGKGKVGVKKAGALMGGRRVTCLR
ncbi:hypothetical protein FQN54_006901 [Arachnomyces sp. PD_36]|nr:hypothetical protein FQN54_006901 [Arachnomyces sp. PD_36]